MGLALLWKTAGSSSQDLLYSFKKSYAVNSLSGRYGIGHSGTLDPFAEGLLLVAWNEGLKILHAFQKLPKTYRAEMLFGVNSASHDTELKLDFSQTDAIFQKASHLKDEDLEKFLEQKKGSFFQVPPQYSAIKVNGKRAYKFARQGEEVELKARESTLFSCRHIHWLPTEYQGKKLWKWNFEVTVSAGTYIRSFARDWAQELVGLPGVLSALTRISIGPFVKNKDSCPYFIKLKDLEQYFDVIYLNQLETRQVQHGVRPEIATSSKAPQLFMSPSGQAVAWREINQPRLARVFCGDPFASAAAITPRSSDKSLVASPVKIH